jgi:hypothetical protein
MKRNEAIIVGEAFPWYLCVVVIEFFVVEDYGP